MANSKLTLVCLIILKVNLCENLQKQQKEAPFYFELEALCYFSKMDVCACGKSLFTNLVTNAGSLEHHILIIMLHFNLSI